MEELKLNGVYDQYEVYRLERWFNLAGLLHDLGKIGISDALIDKSDRLTEEEFKKIKLHPGIGSSLVGVFGLKCTKAVVPMIASHIMKTMMVRTILLD
ncbi:MAG: HD domain-containing protein [Syntrophorhabdaceae bacterium]|nr:HD domain-containing protein [Syntrophorhabdales bacterium]MBP9561333.1 HD domain-containing protein [Syntrophorhabdaceae bacterium]